MFLSQVGGFSVSIEVLVKSFNPLTRQGLNLLTDLIVNEEKFVNHC